MKVWERNLDGAPAAVQLAYFAGWLEHASINAEKKAALIAILLRAASMLAPSDQALILSHMPPVQGRTEP